MIHKQKKRSRLLAVVKSQHELVKSELLASKHALFEEQRKTQLGIDRKEAVIETVSECIRQNTMSGEMMSSDMLLASQEYIRTLGVELKENYDSLKEIDEKIDVLNQELGTVAIKIRRIEDAIKDVDQVLKKLYEAKEFSLVEDMFVSRQEPA